MRSVDKFDIEVIFRPDWDDKKWIKVRFKNGLQTGWIPSFEDFYRILMGLAECEDIKYPLEYHQGRWMIYNLMRQALQGKPWCEIKKDLKIPERDI